MVKPRTTATAIARVEARARQKQGTTYVMVLQCVSHLVVGTQLTVGMIYATHWRWNFHSLRSTKGGQDHSQQPKQPKRQQQQNSQDHPNGNGQPSGSASASAQYRRSGDSQVHAGQRRKATESLTNGITGADGSDRGHAPKRHKSDKTDAMRPHPDFWYPDGSVIIQVKRTQFRLHQSMLQKQSALFAAAFEEMRNLYPELEVRVDERSLKGHDLPVYNLDGIDEMTADNFATLLIVIEEPMCVAASVG